MDDAFWDQRYRDHPSPWSDRPNRFLADTVDALTPTTALDLACGEGRNTLWLARNGWSATGVDFSTVAIDRARHAADAEGLRATFVVGDARTWTTPETFDVVAIVYLHLRPDDMATVIQNAESMLTPGGILFVVGHHRDNIEHGYGGPQVPGILWSEDELAGWFSIPVIQQERALREVHTSEGTRTAIDALVTARAG